MIKMHRKWFHVHFASDGGDGALIFQQNQPRTGSSRHSSILGHMCVPDPVNGQHDRSEVTSRSSDYWPKVVTSLTSLPRDIA